MRVRRPAVEAAAVVLFMFMFVLALSTVFAADGSATGPLRRLPPALGAPGTAPGGDLLPASDQPPALLPDAGAFNGRIEVFREPRDEGYVGRLLPERMEALASARRLLLFRSAQFDPVAQGMPDFADFVPTAIDFMVPPAGANTHWIVQFDRAPAAEDLAGLRARGADPLFYIPNDAYLVRIDHDFVSQIWNVPGVRFIGRYLPGFKVENGIARDARRLRREGPGAGDAGLAELTVLLSPGASAQAVADLVRASLPRARVVGAAEGGGIGLIRVNADALELPQTLAFLANLEDALWVQRHERPRLANDDAVWIAQTFDTTNKRNYALTLKVHNKGIQGHGQIIGVSDTGVDPDTCRVIDRSQGLPPVQNVAPPGALATNTTRQKIIAYNLLRDFEGSAVAYELGTSHGTEVVGCLTGDQGGKAGVTYADPSITDGSHHDTADGMAPGAKIVFQDIGDASGLGGLRVPEITDQLFIQMYDAGARITTNSWGSTAFGYDTQAFFADRMAYNYPDFAIFVPAGNEGPGPGTLTSWGHAKNVIVVGGSQQDPNANSLFLDSGRGPAADGRRKPDVTLTAQSVVSGTSDLTTGTETCGTSTVQGTSFATPLAAGAAALIRQYFTDGWYPSGAKNPADGFSPSSALIKAALLNGARNMTGSGGGNVGPCVTFLGVCRNKTSIACTTNAQCDFSKMDDDAPSDFQGFGRVHLDDVLAFSGDARDLRVWDVPAGEGLATGDEWRAQVYVPSTGGGDLELVLTWTDPPTLSPVLSYLVNDLDIQLVAPDGTTSYWGNSLATRDASNLTTEFTVANTRRASRIDNVEYIRIPAAQTSPGLWTIRVFGTSVPGSPWAQDALRQGFAIALTTDASDNGGTIEFDKTRYDCADTITLRVRDTNAGATATVRVSTAGGDVETFALPAAGTGSYQGSIPTAYNRPIAAGNGVVELVQDERLTARYDDANPVLTATAQSVAECRVDVRLGVVTIAGGCDGDTFLDAGEAVTMTVELVNAGPDPLRNVRATLSSATTDVYVEPVTAAYGDIQPGGAAVNGTAAFRLSARDTVTPRASVSLQLEVVATGREAEPLIVAVPLTLEADEIVTNGSFSENFDTVGYACSGTSCSEDPSDGCLQDSDCPASTCTAAKTCSISGNPCDVNADCANTCTATTPLPDGSWYYFDVSGNCETSEPTWAMATCNGSRRPVLPSCTGTVTATSATNHVLISPPIDTGDPGSTTTLELLTLKESLNASLNPNESTVCDRIEVRLFSNVEGAFYRTEYVRASLKNWNLNEVTTTADFDRTFTWSVPPLPDARVNQLLFWTYLDSPDGGSCTASDGETVRWQVDDVTLTYVNRKVVDDASAPCSPGCSDPPVPANVSVREAEPGLLVVAWDPVSGADHYDLYRDRDGAGYAFLTRVAGTQTSVSDRVPDGASYGYTLRAVSANGLCESANATAATATAAGPCLLAPGAPQNLAVVRDQTASCALTLSWGAAASPCGPPVEYRIYRDTQRAFAPGPHNLLTTTTALTFKDVKVDSGYGAAGAPNGTEYTYLVRAARTASGAEEGNLAYVSGRASGPLAPGTWTEDGGDAVPADMRFTTLQDYQGTGASWSRTIFTIDHQPNGIWTYVAAQNPGATTQYDDLACIALDTPPIRLAGSGSSQFRMWTNYIIEYQWDGLVVELSADGGPFTPITPNGGYPSTFAQTIAAPCEAGGVPPSGYINACNYPPTQGAITGPSNGQVSGWLEYVFDLAAYQGREVRIRLALSSDCSSQGAVVVDEMTVSNAQLPSACTGSPCLPAPVFDGIASARDLDPNADTGVELTWGRVDNWGGGGPGTFALFRGGAQVGSAASAATSYLDDAAPNNRTFHYAAVARSGGGCDLPSGAADITIAAADCAPAGAAADAATLTVQRGTGSIVLRSTVIPGAQAYRFEFANEPAGVAGSPTALEEAAPEARHGVLTDGRNYFYLVRDGSAAACAAP